MLKRPLRLVEYRTRQAHLAHSRNRSLDIDHIRPDISSSSPLTDMAGLRGDFFFYRTPVFPSSTICMPFLQAWDISSSFAPPKSVSPSTFTSSPPRPVKMIHSSLVFLSAVLFSKAAFGSGNGTCFSLDGQSLDDTHKPCKLNSSGFSAGCALNGTSPDNDICMDSGLWYRTSGWYASFYYADASTPKSADPSTLCANAVHILLDACVSDSRSSCLTEHLNTAPTRG